MIQIPDKPFLSERLTYRLAVLADEAILANDEIFARRTGCTILQIRVLRLIDDYPGINFVEIARATKLERSKTSRIVRRLIELGLVERETTAGDARRYRLSTTALGKERRQLARRLSDRLERVLLSPLSGTELEALQSMLERLGQWIRSRDYHREITETEEKFAADSPAIDRG